MSRCSLSVLFEPVCGLYHSVAGDSETAKVVADEADLVKELCSYRSLLCLSPCNAGQQHSKELLAQTCVMRFWCALTSTHEENQRTLATNIPND